MIRIPVFLWSGANQFLEQAVEVRIVVETKIEGDVFYQRIACNQYKLGLLNLFLIFPAHIS